jgi:hypothetical protein
MEFDFDNIDEVPAVPVVNPAVGSKKKKNKEKHQAQQQQPQNPPAQKQELATPAPEVPVQGNLFAEAASGPAADLPVDTSGNLLAIVSGAFDILPDFINDTDAISSALTTILPVKKTAAALIVGLAAGAVTYYCLTKRGA